MSQNKAPVPDYDASAHSDEPIAKTRATAANGHAGGANGHATQALIQVQPISKEEMQPSYAQELPIPVSAKGSGYASMINTLGNCIGTFGAIPCCPCPNPYVRVQQGSVGLVSRFGQFYKAVDPGLIAVNVASESIRTVDIKIQIVQVPRQTVMTKDNVQVDSVLVWHVTNPYRSVFAVADVRQALVERAQTTLRSVVGARTLQSIVTEREQIAFEVEEIISHVADKWGVSVESILVKDILFSEELQNSLSSAAAARRVGESKVIAARAEVDAARLMREAADILSSPAAIQIRQLEALQQMAKSSGAKTIFVPMSLAGMGSVEASRLAEGGNDVIGSTSRIGQLASM